MVQILSFLEEKLARGRIMDALADVDREAMKIQARARELAKPVLNEERRKKAERNMW